MRMPYLFWQQTSAHGFACFPIFSAATKDGYAIHWYTATKDMTDSCLTNADGELLIVPQQGDC